MSIDFTGAKSIIVPEGAVKKITRKSDGVVLWNKLTTWKVYTAVEKTGAPYVAKLSDETNVSYKNSSSIFDATSCVLDANTGIFTLTNYAAANPLSLSTSRKYHMEKAYSGKTVNELVRLIGSSGNRATYRIKMYKSVGTAFMAAGSYISDVSSENENMYPANGIHTDGCWYIKQ